MCNYFLRIEIVSIGRLSFFFHTKDSPETKYISLFACYYFLFGNLLFLEYVSLKKRVASNRQQGKVPLRAIDCEMVRYNKSTVSNHYYSSLF